MKEQMMLLILDLRELRGWNSGHELHLIESCGVGDKRGEHAIFAIARMTPGGKERCKRLMV
jgi:hypothetical protein